jgi:hypothetical protein
MQEGGVSDKPADAKAMGGPEPVTSIQDPRALQILSTEHWSLISNRTLAYNEAFTRAGMFLTFMSMSFVALALIAQVLPVGLDLLVVAAVVLVFDVVLGLTTYGRIIRANYEDFRALHGMARIRRAYVQIAPPIGPYLTTSINDDVRGVMAVYGDFASASLISNLIYALTTSAGMVGMIVALLSGALTLVLALIATWSVAVGFGLAAVVGAATFATLVISTNRFFARHESRLPAMFPTTDD